jgi:hypothetical protein
LKESLKPRHVGAVPFSRTGDPSTGDFNDTKVIKKFGEVPDDLSMLLEAECRLFAVRRCGRPPLPGIATSIASLLLGTRVDAARHTSINLASVTSDTDYTERPSVNIRTDIIPSKGYGAPKAKCDGD